MTTHRRDGKEQTPFAQWVRGNRRLDSKRCGLSWMDIDWIWHRYLSPIDRLGQRTVNHIMLIEEKGHGADLSFAERDTMWILHQAMLYADKCSLKFRTARGDKLAVRFWGYHKLRYDGVDLLDSGVILWDKEAITLRQLEAVLLFDLSPRTLEPRSDRRHHAPGAVPLFINGGERPTTDGKTHHT